MVATAPVIDEPLASPARARMAVLLPLHAGMQASAAQAVAAGIQAAHDEDGLYLVPTTIATTDAPGDIWRAYQTASAQHEIVVGPLSRRAVAMMATKGIAGTPTIALAHPQGADLEGGASSGILMIGMPVEDEAVAMAYWMAEAPLAGQAWVVHGTVAWQQRVARAWIDQARRLGMDVASVEVALTGDAIGAAGLAALRRRMGKVAPVQVLSAMNGLQTQQLRSVLGSGVPLYGTSHVNPFIIDRDYGQAYPLLEGVRFIDIPWQLPGNHAASNRYRHPQGYFGARPTVAQRRLYALGIDAYRIAREIAQGRREFELDGVTGKLTVAIDTGGITYFQRQYVRAQFLEGSVVPLPEQAP